MARSVLMAEVGGGKNGIDRGRLDGWCEGGHEHQRDDGGGCATMR